MKLKHAKKNSGFTLVELLVVIAIIASLAAISSPIIIRQIARARATTAISNSKDIYIAVRDHAFKNGGETVTVDTDSTTTFQILFNTGFLQDEKPFFVPGSADNTKEAGNEDNTLDATENVFSYFAAPAAPINITNDSASTPLLSTPVDTVGTALASIYDFGHYGGQAVVVTADGAAAAYPLLENTASPGDGTIISAETGVAYTPSTTPFPGNVTNGGAAARADAAVCVAP